MLCRFTLAGTEVSALLGRMPGIGFNLLSEEMGAIQERSHQLKMARLLPYRQFMYQLMI